MNRATLALIAASCLALPAAAFADTTTVNATDVIYAAGGPSIIATNAGGTAPGYLNAAGVNYFTFNNTGLIVVNNGTGTNFNDADGVGAASATNVLGLGSLSGISTSYAGYLVGVFVPAGGPTGPAPTSLSYGAGGNSSENAATFMPALDQVFFIGDGLTGDGSGDTQQFYVPTGAAQLYLGIADACGYSGAPGCYGDNVGAFTVNYNAVGDVVLNPPAATPEPSSLALLGTAVLGSAGAIRRRLRK